MKGVVIDMHAKAVRTRGGEITIRPLRSGDTSVICGIFGRMGAQSRRLRFGAAKNGLTRGELEVLSAVDARRHVLVAYAGREPIGVARLARDEDDRTVAEIAFAVVDDWQGKGVGTALMEELSAVARAAGIQRFRASILAENRASLALMRHVTTIEQTRYDGSEIEIVGRAA